MLNIIKTDKAIGLRIFYYIYDTAIAVPTPKTPLNYYISWKHVEVVR